MDLIEGARISWRNVREHKLRSTLTTLGVIIGVAAVITFVTLGASLQQDIISTVAGGNAATMYVTAQSPGDSQLPSLGGGSVVFTEYDVNQIRQLRGVEIAAPESGIAASSMSHNNSSVGRQWVTVSSPGYFRVRNIDFAAGRPYRSGEQEVVLNRPAAQMFPGNVTVGENVSFTRAANGEVLNATVVGIVESQGGEGVLSGIQGDGEQPRVYAPSRPYYDRTVSSPNLRARQLVYGRILVSATSPGQVDAVQGRVYSYLGERSDARQLKSNNYQFEVTTQEQIVGQIRQLTSTFTAYISGIAVISLVVGSIGIANIMLVSVAERTREIGIMKAVGAQNRDVLQLFLAEAVMLGVLGSALGALVGLGAAFAGARAIGLPLAFQPVWFVAAVVVGVVVGVLAGLYPAWDAARTDPIDALRHE
ncbi:ABC transporter permease [Halorussus litoreus]|uniref:ABC transporter permease n=1 Tax=Halorussus litoreus TaxID=1710536 RepID=UPI000E22086E|nr:ABC transporter permease [Halorussus litoreus]